MSKRFGRNKKRKMRQQIADLKYAQAMDRGLAEHTGRKLRALESEMREWEERVRALLGHASGFTRTPGRIASAQPMPPEFQTPLMRQLPGLGAVAPGTPPRSGMDIFNTTMYRLETAVHEGADLAAYVHLYIGHNDKLGYYMSRKMLDALGLGPEGMRYVAEDIARRFDAELRK